MWKKIIPAALALILMSGCQPTPDTAAVVSKNDGAFEAALTETAIVPEEAAEEDSSAAPGEPEIYTERFVNTEGNIAFSVEVERPADTAVLPVLRIRPRTITPEFAKHVASVLFGDAPVYAYSEETASVQETLCDWTFHPRNEEWYRTWDPEYAGDFKTQYLFAASERDGIPFLFTVRERDEADYREHVISCQVNSDLLESGYQELWEERGSAEEGLEAARAAAEALLEAIEPGKWVIDSCIADGLADGPDSGGFLAVVTACPVYNGVKVTHQQQMFLNLYDVYASTCSYEEVVLWFSGGRLTGFQYTSPMEVVEVVNESVAYLSFEEAMDQCRTRLQRSVLKANLFAMERFYAWDLFTPNAASKQVDIYEAELGLTRTRIKDNAEDFYLLPAYTFRAVYACYDSGGNLLADSREFGPASSVTRELLVVNAVDGSIINTELGY